MSDPSILVVDDEPEVLSTISDVLEKSGYSVQTAKSGEAALELFEKSRGGCRLVITDMKLPKVSGMDILERVKSVSPKVPVIMITAFGTINKAVSAMQEGASDYLLKPFSADALQAAVKRVFRGNGNGGAKEAVTDDTKRFITCDPKLKQLLQMARGVAASMATVLICGESGTGKELLAAHIHRHSRAGHLPYVAVNCAALPESLAESELFGHEKGAFTGAVTAKKGKFELAGSGTVVLDEISEMPLPLQAKLLRVLQEKEVDRVGGTRPVPVSARVIAISNKDLKKEVKEGRFREDLFYRVNVIPFTIPPLRDRPGDIEVLAAWFLEKFSRENQMPCPELAGETLDVMKRRQWKGNVRELENTMERALLLSGAPRILPEHLFFDPGEESEGGDIPIQVGLSMKEMERQLIVKTLSKVNDNRTHAAEILGISIRTLRNKLKEYKLKEGGDQAGGD